MRSLLFPHRCACCGALLPRNATQDPLCAICRTKYEYLLGFSCSACNQPQIQCRCRPVYASRSVRAYIHICSYADKIVRQIVVKLKRTRRHDLIAFCVNAMEQALLAECAALQTEPQAFLLVPVPPSAHSIQTGVDASWELARQLAKQTGAQAKRLLYRVADAAEQKTLNRTQRLTHALQIFRLRKHARRLVAGRQVVIIDDVLTTGASCYACAALLHQAGADSITVLTFAKTPRHLSQP